MCVLLRWGLNSRLPKEPTKQADCYLLDWISVRNCVFFSINLIWEVWYLLSFHVSLLQGCLPFQLICCMKWVPVELSDIFLNLYFQDPTNLDKFNVSNFFHVKNNIKVVDPGKAELKVGWENSSPSLELALSHQKCWQILKQRCGLYGNRELSLSPVQTQKVLHVL